MRISDWSSDVCSSDLVPPLETRLHPGEARLEGRAGLERPRLVARPGAELAVAAARREIGVGDAVGDRRDRPLDADLAAQRLPVKQQRDLRVRSQLAALAAVELGRSEEHTSELQ